MGASLSFKYNNRQELVIANLGNHSSTWSETTSAEYSKNKEGLFKEIEKKRFDIVPAKNKSGIYSHYVSFTKWGDFAINSMQLSKVNNSSDCIYYLTHIEDAIRLMVEKQRFFYFLSDHTNVIGLFTISDFNNKAFYYWLYQKLVDVELLLGKYLLRSKNIKDIEQRVEELSAQNDDLGKWFMESYGRYSDDIKTSVDSSIIEYLYFGQLIELVKKLELFSALGYKTINDFENGCKALYDIRNKIAHPIKSIVIDLSSLNSVRKAINKMEELTERLDSHAI